jgi:hypothetical protein
MPPGSGESAGSAAADAAKPYHCDTQSRPLCPRGHGSD